MSSPHCESIKWACMISVGKAQRKVPLDRLTHTVEYYNWRHNNSSWMCEYYWLKTESCVLGSKTDDVTKRHGMLVASLHYIRDAPRSYLDKQTGWLRLLFSFLITPTQIPGHYLKLNSNCFFPRPFQLKYQTHSVLRSVLLTASFNIQTHHTHTHIHIKSVNNTKLL